MNISSGAFKGISEESPNCKLPMMMRQSKARAMKFNPLGLVYVMISIYERENSLREDK